jgi:hypothetical protein
MEKRHPDQTIFNDHEPIIYDEVFSTDRYKLCPNGHGMSMHRLESNGKNRGKCYRCLECRRVQKAERHDRYRRILMKMLGGYRCHHCGKRKHMKHLEFHHAYGTKSFDLGGVSYSLARMKEEVKKCILLCHDCHVIEHRRIRAEKKANGTQD